MLKRFAMFALLCVSLASAKTYSFTVNDPAQAGHTRLTPGEYHLKLDGSQVVLMDASGHRVDANAAVQAADHKFDQTAVITTKADGTNRINSIELGGSKSKIVFQ